MVRKRESIKQKVKEVFIASPPSENVEEAVDDSLEDDLFAQLDAKDDAEQESQPQESQPASKSHSNRSETEIEQKKTRKAKREVRFGVDILYIFIKLIFRKRDYKRRNLSDRLHLRRLIYLKMRNLLRKQRKRRRLS